MGCDRYVLLNQSGPYPVPYICKWNPLPRAYMGSTVFQDRLFISGGISDSSGSSVYQDLW